MATALKDISFTTPVMSGGMSYKGGTTYYLGLADTIDADFSGGSITLIEYGSGCGWLFNGHATSADQAWAVSEGPGGSNLTYSAIAPKLDCITVGSGVVNYFLGGLTNGGSSLDFFEIYDKLHCITAGSGANNYFLGGLTNGGSSLDFFEIYDRIGIISYGGSEGALFDGGLSCSGTPVLKFTGGGSSATPLIRIGVSDYSLSVDDNGFVKATVN